MMAKRGLPSLVASAASCTHTCSIWFTSSGNSSPARTAIGVSTEKISLSKTCSTALRLAVGQLAAADAANARFGQPLLSMLAKAVACWALTISWVRLLMAASCSLGVMPAGSGVVIPCSTSTCSPPTRTMKNSSRFDAVIARNFSRSSSGSDSSSASSSTRWLNSSQLSSRLKKRGWSVMG